MTNEVKQDEFDKWRKSSKGIESNSWNNSFEYTAKMNFNSGFDSALKFSENEIDSLNQQIRQLQSELLRFSRLNTEILHFNEKLITEKMELLASINRGLKD